MLALQLHAKVGSTVQALCWPECVDIHCTLPCCPLRGYAGLPSRGLGQFCAVLPLPRVHAYSGHLPGRQYRVWAVEGWQAAPPIHGQPTATGPPTVDNTGCRVFTGLTVLLKLT